MTDNAITSIYENFQIIPFILNYLSQLFIFSCQCQQWVVLQCMKHLYCVECINNSQIRFKFSKTVRTKCWVAETIRYRVALSRTGDRIKRVQPVTRQLQVVSKSVSHKSIPFLCQQQLCQMLIKLDNVRHHVSLDLSQPASYSY